ncbi:relaxase/mobilization nuclease domain-containing protein [Desulfovibrio sp. JC022]|uniref:relaxase/mobilization nuclease domain-containing protein n=1 Tax=Desulfovibrio sp. JC022 TaxID=2593642 RepID=UPI0013D710E3|nr:relaxase/mobilization nuclease domain-containing protein [Desulfovibrio sp. JC022]NDV24705.1 hypothetical protein [Desulfovibrio sp. JC022]
MLMKVFRHGVGRGSKVIGYVTGQHDARRKVTPPEVLRGDPDSVCDLIDTTTRKWKYTSGVLSWAPGDEVTPEDEKKLMDGFESMAFAGMEPDQYSILWVRHSHAGHHEMHFVIPRTELRTDKAFNPCPPGWEKQYNPWCELQNRRRNWARPDELKRARLVSLGSSIQSYKSGNASEIRRTVTEAIVQGVETGLIHNRQDIINTLEEFGFAVPRKGKEYITIEIPKDENDTVSRKRKNNRIRLKGVLYAESWTVEEFKQRAELGRENETADGRAGAKFQADNSRRIAELEQRVAGIRETRAEYHRSRYKSRSYSGQESSGKLDRKLKNNLTYPAAGIHSPHDSGLPDDHRRDHDLGEVGGKKVAGNNAKPERIPTGFNQAYGKAEKGKNPDGLGNLSARSRKTEVPDFPQGHENPNNDDPRRGCSTIHRRVDYDRVTAELIGFDEPDRTAAGPTVGSARRQDSGLGAGNTRLPRLAERIGESIERVGKIVRSMKKLMWRFKKVRGRGAGLGR